MQRGITLTAALAAAEAVRGSVDAALLATAASAALGTASAAVMRLASGSALARLPLMLIAALVLGAGTLWLLPATPPAVDEPPRAAQAQQPAPPALPHAGGRGEPLPPEAIARIGSPNLRHAVAVNAVAYAPDGKSIVSFDEAGYLCIWNAATGANERRWRPATKAGWGTFACRRDGKSLVVFDGRDVVTIDAATGKPSVSFSTKLSPPIAFNPSFDRNASVLAFHRDNVLTVIDIAARKERFRASADGQTILSTVISPDGKSVAAVVDSGSILLFDAVTGKVRRRLDGHYGFGPLVFAPEGKWLLCVDADPLLCDVDTGKILGKIKYGSASNHRRSAAFSPDGKRVAFSGYDEVVVAEAPSGREIIRLPVQEATSLMFAPDSVTLLAGSRGGEISQWHTATGRLLDASASPFPRAHGLQFLDDRRLCVLARTPELWDVRTARLRKRFAPPNAARFRAADVSPDGRWLAYRGPKGEVRLVDTEDPLAVRRLTGQTNGCLAVRFAPDGRTLFATAWDKKLRGWDVATGELRQEWNDAGELRNVLVASPDGRWIMTASTAYQNKPDNAIRMWDVRVKRLAHTIVPDGERFVSFAFSADGARLAAAGGASFDPNVRGRIVLFDTASGKRIASINGRRGSITTVAFSPDGRCLVAAERYMEKQIAFRYWELATALERHRFAGHLGPVQALAFSPTGALLAAASPDAPVYVWDLYGRHGGKSPPASWSPQERDRLWQALGSPDATAGFKALRRLIRAPGAAIELLRGRLNPAEAVGRKRVRQWLTALDSTDFAERQTAFAELEKLGDRIESRLRKALVGARSVEAKRRIETLLAKAAAPTPERLSRGRALEALEQIATPAAVRLLEALAAGEPSARLTREAAAACARLQKRPSR